MNPISLRSSPPEAPGPPDASAITAELYAEHALALTRLARIMLGDQEAAQDVVHDAFCGLIRRWSRLTDQDRAAAYLRAAVLNGCRDALRRQARRPAALSLRPKLLGDDLSRVMRIGESSVRSAVHRGLAGLARLLAGETS